MPIKGGLLFMIFPFYSALATAKDSKSKVKNKNRIEPVNVTAIELYSLPKTAIDIALKALDVTEMYVGEL
jgi:hypothetical protein